MTFQNARGQNIYTTQWMPEGEPKAVILIAHGLAEHSHRYDHVADAFIQNGYAVYALDHAGHGQSDGLRAYFDTLKHPVADLEQYFEQVQAAHPDKKIFLYGHSMGALISLMFTLKHQSKLAGFISSGTPIMLDEVTSGILESIGNLLNRIVPRLPITPLSSSQLSHDAEVVKAYDNDPLVFRRPVRVRMGLQLLNNGRIAREKIHELRLPLYVFHGSEDAIAPPSGSDYLYQNAGSPDKTIHIYNGLYHETHNEIDKKQIINDIIDWLNAHN